jgi:hypothetical protein
LSDPWTLSARQGLPPEMAALCQSLPRARATDTQLSDLARFWLQMHDGFRRETAMMTAGASDLRAGRADARGFHDRALPVLSGFLQHLDGHHRIETGHYFPQFRRLDTRLQPALDLLDRDHDAIHAHLEALAATGNALHQAVRSGSPAADAALRLADTLDAAQSPLNRHLDDEEDIVVPVLQRAGIG